MGKSGKMPGDSFTFNGKNSLSEWGIKVIAHDEFSAKKRDRRRTIPFMNGFHDFGEKFYTERLVKLDCCTETKRLTKGEMREIVYFLSKKGKLTLWDESDKFYVGELLDSSDVNVLPKYVKQQFTLTFTCLPFAFGEEKDVSIEDCGDLTYGGTVDAPCVVVIKNNNAFGVRNVKITVIKEINVED